MGDYSIYSLVERAQSVIYYT